MGAKDRAGLGQQKHRVSADKLTLASVVDHIGKAVAAHGNYVADRWEGRTDRELNLLVTVSPVKPGGFRVRWQYRDAVGDLHQKQKDLFAWEESALPSLGFELVRANALATAFRNPHSEPQEGGDPLHKLLKEIHHEHPRLENKKDSGKPSGVDHDRVLSPRRPAKV